MITILAFGKLKISWKIFSGMRTENKKAVVGEIQCGNKELSK